MTTVTCPYCNVDMSVAMILDGIPLQCSTCGNSFSPQRELQAVGGDYGTPQVFVVSHTPAPRLQPRLKAGGWFSRAFATTSGVLMAILAFMFVAFVTVLFFFVIVMAAANNASSKAHPERVSGR